MSRARIRITKDQDEWDLHGWSSVPNQLLRDDSLSVGARWAFAWMASHRPDFYITAADVAKAGAVGINKAEGFVKELETAGYVSRFYTRDPKKGWITGVEYRLHPMPLPAEQRTNGKRGPRAADDAPRLEVVSDG
jgi:hypothetical protein